jgi:long-chain acyl-CoA synthetase
MSDAMTSIDRCFGTLPRLVASLRDAATALSVDAHWGRAALHARATQIAATLAHAGVASGDRVALVAPSGPEWLATFLAIAACGAVPVLVDPRLAAADLAAVLVHADPRLVLADPALAAPVSLRRLALPLTLRHDAAPAAAVLVAPDAPALIVYTSGTSGAPKGVVLSHAALAAQAAAALAMPQAASRFARHLCVLPLNFILALSAALATLAAGGTLLFCGSLMPQDILDLQQRCAATSMVAVPRLLESLDRALAAQPARPAPATFEAFAILCGGAALDDALRLRLAARGLQVYPIYGMTEAGPAIAANAPGALRPGSVGRPYPGVTVAIDPATGEILVRSPGVMLGYFRDEAATRTALRDGWLHTGDVGRLDADGYLTVIGRLKDLIVLPSGRKIAPERIESALVDAAALAECCLVERNGALVLVAVLRPGEAPSAARAHGVLAACRALQPHERAARVHIHPAPLPRTATGKLQRRAVEALLASAPMPGTLP